MYRNIVALLVLTAVTLTAPSDVSAQQKFDAVTLLSHVRELASDEYGGREAGTAGNEAARTYIAADFEESGLAAFEGGYISSFEAGKNVIGFVGGTSSPDQYIVMTAHFDHLGKRDGKIFNGADDNASGTAALLIAAAYFKKHPLSHSIIFAALDAEEKGLLGAKAFVKNPPVNAANIGLNINMDMISHNDKDELYAVGTYHYPFLKPYLETVGASADIKLMFGHDVPGTGHDDWTSASDHGPFHRQWKLPFVYFGVEDHEDYHKHTDEYNKIEPAFYIQAVDTILDAVIELDKNLEAIVKATPER
ncbi:MAG: M28 family peptidase [Rhodothermales bacterium]